MPFKHGQKVNLQLLLDRNRFELLEGLAKQADVRATALARNAIYAYLEKVVPVADYKAAKAADDAVWAESVKRRVQARRKPQSEAETQQP
jgi:hypothetical protein